jgi:hypothetical protein
VAVVSVGTRAAERLLSEKERLAASVTRALYTERADLLVKYGETGREKCLEDMRYNVEHLAPAVDLGEPEMFAAYVRWLDSLLRARQVATDEVILSLELMEAEVRSRFTEDEAEAVSACLRAGVAVLREPGSR